MKRTLLLLMLCLPMLAIGQKKKIKQANEDTASWRYEIEAETTGVQGTVVVKVWSFSKDPKVATEQAKKNAIHGVIFKGVAAKERIPALKPLVPDNATEAQHADFFNSFFGKGGDYMRFVTLTNSGAIEAGDVMKVSKKEYKVGVVVTVSYSELRSYLEANKVIKRLDAGF